MKRAAEPNKSKSVLQWKFFVPITVIIIFVVSIVNIFMMQSFPESTSTASTVTKSASQNIQVMSSIMPKGTPKIYGSELGIKFDDISSSNPQKADAAIKKLGMLDNQVMLQGKELQRYIAVASQISCEYCCGGNSIITADGRPACGCAHSYAMRGLAKYLIKNHPKEFTNEEILEELAKLKTLFFPAQMSRKAAVLQSRGIEFTYTNLGSNKYRGIEASVSAGSGNSMVGGC